MTKRRGWVDALRDVNLEDRRVDLDRHALARALLEVADLVIAQGELLETAAQRIKELEECTRKP